jgi:ABC-2 type transport system permease protein
MTVGLDRTHGGRETFSFGRVAAVILRHLYVMRTSWPRLFELAYWPIMQMVLWGFINQFLMTKSSWVAQAAGILIAAVLLWDVLFRGQLGISVSFLEEIWSRNLAALFVTPLRPSELATALLGMSLVRTLIGVGPAAALAIVLYNYSIFTLGLPLIGFFANLLVMGWAIGLAIAALILRFGLGAESLAWMAIFAIAPVSGIWYPISTLPPWLQPVSWALPSAYVFEGMRAVMLEGRIDWSMLATAAGLNVLYIAAGLGIFLWMFARARRDGLLLRIGE